MDTCTPLAPGTILRTMSGTEFRLLAEHAVGGNAILYRAKQIDSQLDVTLKELCPPGSHRAGGILVSRSAGDVLLQRKADKLLKERAAEEFGSGQSINNETLHALLTLGLLDIRSIREPDGTVYQNADGTSLPCVFLYMPTLNKAKGFFLRELLEECAAFPHSETHPLGNRQDIVEPEITTPDVLTCLRIVGLLLEALQSIHKTWIHGDISLDNLFVDGDLHLARPRGVFLLDFGSARPLDASGKTALIHTGDALYTTNVFSAPEINDFRQNGTPLQLTAAADVYSVGRLLRLLLNSEALCAIREGNAISLTLQMTDTNLYELDVDRSARPFLNELNGILRAAAEKDPAQRISVSDMLTKINALISRLTAVRSPLMENLSSPEVFIPHSRDTELKELDEKIHSPERPIFLWGQGGLGKTETARAFLLQCKQKGLRVSFFSYEHSVRDTILNLKFTNFQMPSFFGMTPEQQEETLYQTKLGLLAEMGENSVVVMDNFDSDLKTFDELRQESAYQDLISICGPHLVITTRFEPDSNAVEIRPLADEILLKLMLKEMDVKEIHDSGLTSTLHDIIDAIQGHTLTCYLIAKSIKHSLGRLSAQDVLNALNQYNLHSLPQLVSSDKDRKYTKTTIYGHLKVLFDLSKMTGVYRTVLCHTVLLPQKGLDSTMFFDGETQEEQFALMELVERGWVQHIHLNSNTHLLSIHPLIRELIINELNPTEDECRSFFEQLDQTFENYYNLLEESSYIETPETIRAAPYPKDPNYDFEYDLGCLYETSSDFSFVSVETKITWLYKALNHFSESQLDDTFGGNSAFGRCFLKYNLLRRQCVSYDIWQKCALSEDLITSYSMLENSPEEWKEEQTLDKLFSSISEDEVVASGHQEDYRNMGVKVYCNRIRHFVEQNDTLPYDNVAITQIRNIATDGEAFILKYFGRDGNDKYSYPSALCEYYRYLSVIFKENDFDLETAELYSRKKADEWIRINKQREADAKRTGKELTCLDYFGFGNHAKEYYPDLAFQYYMAAINLSEQMISSEKNPPLVIYGIYYFCAERLRQQGDFEKADLYEKRGIFLESKSQKFDINYQKKYEERLAKEKSAQALLYSANHPTDNTP